MEKVFFKEGTVISREGDYEPFMYLLIRGKVGSYIEYGTPEQRVIELNGGQNALVGEYGMFLSKPRIATFVALEDTEAYKVTFDNISELFAKKQSKIVEMMQKMCEKNEHLSVIYGDACRAMSDYISDSRNKNNSKILEKINRFFSLEKKYNKRKRKPAVSEKEIK